MLPAAKEKFSIMRCIEVLLTLFFVNDFQSDGHKQHTASLMPVIPTMSFYNVCAVPAYESEPNEK